MWYDVCGDKIMILDTLTPLIGLKKQTIVRQLKQLNISYVVSKHMISFHDQPYENAKGCFITLHFFMQKFSSIRLEYTYETVEEGDLLNTTLKHNLVSSYGKPNSDNSKHQSTDIITQWYFQTRITFSKHDQDQKIVILITHQDAFKVNTNRKLWIISMLSGVLWGLLFFIFMGLVYGYDLFLFILSMSGGLIWGAVFGVVMIIGNKKGLIHKPTTFTKGNLRTFKAYEKERGLNVDCQRCLCTFRSRRGIKLYKTTIYLEEHKFTFAYLIMGRLFEKTLPYSNIDYYYDYNNQKRVVMRLNDQTQLSILNEEGLTVVTQQLDEILGYNEPRFETIRQQVYESILEFDPAGLIEGGAEHTIFEMDSRNLTKIMYMENPISEAALRVIIERYFIDTPIIDWSPLSKMIFEKTNQL